ncbi:DUF2235 domain-containing protein [Ancylobacter sp. WKF20]|uniref:DUF2235 domain-containing protein n=1 Tax=Ancylobacter sp. WKF20 TaxID=3039801 RepID=UPI00243433F9|nr:DUF2235 domain-containing protein [Ancylobacter sp. WKF20]WGD31559.1 DUF2235 domain-containing protein [Ancylobacter sp. WKF20]
MSVKSIDPSAERTAIKRLPRRLILCLDGTWNDPNSEDITNIVRLRDMLQPGVTDGVEQRIYYDEGVGTAGGFDKLAGGAIGTGLDVNVRQAYRFLSQFYAPGDDIFIFGFSRGAFTARSLAGYIGASGLLKAENCTTQNEQTVWELYRTPPKDRYPADTVWLRTLTHDGVRIRGLGVFDTVGSLGIPGSVFRRNRERYEFHDTALSSIIDVSLHAVAIDEKRRWYPPALWQVPQHAGFTAVEQVWFPGVHSDIGGGYQAGGIGALTLAWMLKRLDALTPAGHAPVFRPGELEALQGEDSPDIHESRQPPLFFMDRNDPTYRVIAQQRPRGAGVRVAGLPPQARSIGEHIHVSALARLTDGKNEVGGAYDPPNLRAALEAYFSPTHTVLLRPKIALGFVGKESRPLDWIGNAADFDELRAALPQKYRADLEKARNVWAPAVKTDKSSRTAAATPDITADKAPSATEETVR